VAGVCDAAHPAEPLDLQQEPSLMKRAILVLAAVALVASLAACTATDLAEHDCLRDGRVVYEVPDDHGTPWPASTRLLENGTAIDARGDVWDTTNPGPNGYRVGIKIHAKTGSRNDLCLVGGRITSGELDPENTSWNTWHSAYGMIVEVDDITVIGTSFANTGDMISFQGEDWHVIGVRAEAPAGWPGAYIHDDCIENDGMENGIVEDSKFDGCNIFMSSNSGVNGGHRTVRVTDTLVRLQAYRNNFDVPKYGENTHGGFFKFANPLNVGQGTPPKLVIKDSVFRADQPGSFGGNAGGFLGLPPGTECDNVMLIGTEAWQARDRASWQAQCTNLTYGTIADWNARVADWDADHPAR
jgi:hypothetical protein